MKITAKEAEYSSVVGGGVLLIDANGKMIGQIAFLCHDDYMRDKDVQLRLGKIITDAINDPGASE